MNDEIMLKALQYKNNILKSLSDNKKMQYYRDLCRYIKEVSFFFYDFEHQEINDDYNLLLNCLTDVQDLLPFKYIIHNQPKTHIVNNIKTMEDVLDNIVRDTRNEINGYNLNKDLKGYCLEASSIVSEHAKDYSLPYQEIKLFPGFSESPDVCQGSFRHYFGIVAYEDKKYLIDCTYSQFFLLKRCIIDRLGLMKYAGANAGLYVKMDNFREKVAKKILKDGWIELDPGVLKAYLDVFALSYRNGLYYEQTQDFSYTTPYTDDVYWSFLNGEDNQFNYEKPITLGYQARPLKDSKMVFNKR